jgi:4-azaleucine resistance transporter AzlC
MTAEPVSEKADAAVGKGPAISERDSVNGAVRPFFEGARDTLPLVIGAMPFGIIFGALSGGCGLSAAATIAMSLFVFAGSAQFIALGLVCGGTAWPLIVLTTIVVNFRHLLYAATLLPFLRRLPPAWQAILSFWLTDETFAVAAQRHLDPKQPELTRWYQLGSAVFMYTNWNACTLVGLAAGRHLSGVAGWGLDFAMPATFIGMVIPFLKDRPGWISVLAAGAVSIPAAALPHKLGLVLAALVGIAAGLAVETSLCGRSGGDAGSGERGVSW